jgi:hypothetical protein
MCGFVRLRFMDTAAPNGRRRVDRCHGIATLRGVNGHSAEAKRALTKGGKA